MNKIEKQRACWLKERIRPDLESQSR